VADRTQRTKRSAAMGQRRARPTKQVAKTGRVMQALAKLPVKAVLSRPPILATASAAAGAAAVLVYRLLRSGD
jgi:hypothetical protein